MSSVRQARGRNIYSLILIGQIPIYINSDSSPSMKLEVPNDWLVYPPANCTKITKLTSAQETKVKTPKASKKAQFKRTNEFDSGSNPHDRTEDIQLTGEHKDDSHSFEANQAVQSTNQAEKIRPQRSTGKEQARRNMKENH
ncbi:hypothetical protein CSKR_200386 [Clonorchis sinensis]|uniref:Uncharacterized protein n=1 Tax=Clonorchis sinensis TaxID=79923 RepID=A0A8T1MD44_CLOSI|nr:hypothetical protein CSKR_200386 [Clonorchis sinensis]